MEFRVGDRVVGETGYMRGIKGTVVNLFALNALVEFDENVHGHNGNDGTCRDGHGWYCTPEEITLLAHPKPIAEVTVEGDLARK